MFDVLLVFLMDPNYLTATQFPHPDVAAKIAIATGIGLLVGLEREWAQKEIGVRTFAITGLLGMLAVALSPSLVFAALVAVLLMVTFLNIHSLLRDRSLELTTSICLVVVFVLGALVGNDHYFTAAASAIVMMLLLAWKVELERFAGALRPEEIRSAVLLGLLSVVIYPLLPDRFIDSWDLINPRQSWVIVVVIAGIGFLNYVLLRLYADRGIYYAALLGGLVNSTAAVAELSAIFRGRDEWTGRAVAALLLTNVAMFIRNGIILIIFAPQAAAPAIAPLLVMAGLSALIAWQRNHSAQSPDSPPPLKLSSPVSLSRILKFAILFVLLSAAGTLAERYLGSAGFLIVSIAGGIVSSASTTATAASLAAAGQIDPLTASLATVLTSVASAIVNMPLVYQQTRQRTLARRLAVATAIVVSLGLATAGVEWMLQP
ncbi:MAG TPA: DUF4010 domain-containing protein [Tepidisphaeraceae bacterium]|jgi:uncharacterized membrane protein (DUF4010 family)|nr:DUF4010 domain-containing protein [Tepidisphaeraceae bacterium]